MEEHSDSTMFYYHCIPATESTKWTDLTRVNYLNSPQSGRTLQRDKYSCPQGERTPRGLNVLPSPQGGQTP